MISIIIPTYNEEGYIGQTIRRIKENGSAASIKEIIVADGGSEDGTIREAAQAGATTLLCSRKGRAAQMNEGAAYATAPLLYFLHADSVPPQGFDADIFAAVKKGYKSGSYSLRFDHDHWFLSFIAWFTRFDTSLIRFGDQSLFVERETFLSAGGYNDSLSVMEDHEIIERLKSHGPFILMPGRVTTSARKFLQNGPFRLMMVFLYIYLLYYFHIPQNTLLKHYRKLVMNGKI